MADNTQNTGANTNPAGNIDPSRVKNYLKELIEGQEDLSGVLKDTLRELKKTELSYEKIQARLERVTSGAIDVKSVQTDLNRLVDKEFIKKRQLEEIEKEAGERGRERLNQIKIEAQAYVDRVKNTSLATTYEEAMMDFLAIEEDHMITQLFLSEQSLELAKKRVTEGENLLSVEKKLSASLGIEGKLLKNFADKLGIGAEFYEEMSRKARKLNEEGKKFGFIDKVQLLGKVAKAAFTEAVKSPLTYITAIYSGIKKGLDLAKQGLDSLTGTGGPLASFVSPFTNIIKEIPIVGGLIGGLIDTFANLIDFATGTVSKIQEFINKPYTINIAQDIELIIRSHLMFFIIIEMTTTIIEIYPQISILVILS